MGKKKILFSPMSTYQLLEMMVYVSKYESESETVLFFADFLIQKFPQYEKLSRFFTVLVPYTNATIIRLTPAGTLSDEIPVSIDGLLQNNGYSITDFDEIHVAACHWRFGAYLVAKQIPFFFWEDAAGILSRPEHLLQASENGVRDDIKAYWEEHGLLNGSNPVIQKRFCNFSVQVEGFQDDKAENFALNDELGAMEEEPRNAIIDFFLQGERFTIPENAMVIFTEHLAHLRLMTLDEQCLVYQLFLDYFFEGRTIVIKPHPDDMGYYEFLFPESQVIRTKFPAELLPYVFSNKPRGVATLTSTAVLNLAPCFDESLILNRRFSYDLGFKQIHKYYTALLLAENLRSEVDAVVSLGVNNLVLEKLAVTPDFHWPEFTVREWSKEENCWELLLVDDLSCAGEETLPDLPQMLRDLPEEKAVLFLNSQSDFCFYEPGCEEIWNDIIPLCIQKKQVRKDDFYLDCIPETIYFYSKSEELKKMAANFNFTKTLKHTGAVVTLDRLTDDQLRIKVLEGILAAMEKRMQCLIEENRKLSRKG